MKKLWICLLLVALLSFSLVACGDDEVTPEDSQTESSAPSGETQPADTDPANTDGSDGPADTSGSSKPAESEKTEDEIWADQIEGAGDPSDYENDGKWTPNY